VSVVVVAAVAMSVVAEPRWARGWSGEPERCSRANIIKLFLSVIYGFSK
jgi:hypothetical protein